MVIREDYVAYLEAQFCSSGSIAPDHALLVRPLRTGYQVISGHQRLTTAQRAGLQFG